PLVASIHKKNLFMLRPDALLWLLSPSNQESSIKTGKTPCPSQLVFKVESHTLNTRIECSHFLLGERVDCTGDFNRFYTTARRQFRYDMQSIRRVIDRNTFSVSAHIHSLPLVSTRTFNDE